MPTPALLLALTTARSLAQAPTPPGRGNSFASELTILLLTVMVIGLLVVVGLLAGTLGRWRRRQRPEPVKPKPSGQGPDAWEEAGRRASVPTPEQLSGEPAQPRASAADMLKSDFGGKRPIALITGGSRRVGRAIAVALARGGCDIVLTYNSSESVASDVVRELESFGVRAVAHQVDFLDMAAVELFAGFIVESLPRLDVVVHNASVYTATPVHDLAPEEADQQFRVNALTPLVLTARLVPLLRDSTRPGGGSVVAMLDIHAMGRPRKNFVAYAMSKAALAEMVNSLAKDLAPFIRVNGVAPGVVAWPENGIEADEAAQAKYLKRVPLGKPGTPEDAAEAVRWLAMDAPYITGEVIRVDGGRWLT